MISKLKIGTRLTLSFSIIILAVFIIWGVSMAQIGGFVRQSEKNYNYNTIGIMNSYEIGNALSSIRIIMRDISLVNTISKRQAKYDAIEAAYGTLLQNIDNYNNEVMIYSDNHEEKQYLDIIEKNITEYMSAVERSKSIGLQKDDIGLAVDEFMLEYTQNAVNAITAMNQLIEYSNNMSISANEDAQAGADRAIAILIGALIIVVVLAVSLTIFITKSITKPIGMLLQNAEKFAKGSCDFNMVTLETKDEIGSLSSSFTDVINVIISLLDEMDEMALKHEKGEIDAVIDTSRFPGVFNKVAIRINEMVLTHINVNKKAIGCINDIVNGSFSSDIEKLPGKMTFINDGIDNVRDKIKMINDEVISLTHSALEGDLKRTIDINKYSGDWVALMDGLNKLINAIEMPIREVTSVL